MAMDIENKVLPYFLPKIGEILFAAIFVGAVLLGPQMMNIDGDLGRHITIGSHILKTRSVPTKDIFSHTKFGDPLTPHEWFTQLLFAIFHRIGGFDAVVWLSALVIASAFWVVYQSSKQRTGSILFPLLVTMLGAAASSLHWLTRPHIFTFLFVALWVKGLEGLRSGPKRRWWNLPVIMLIWVNAHGAFIAGMVIWAMYVVGMRLDGNISNWRDFKPWFYAGTASLLVTGLNPAGFHIWGTSVGFLGNEYLVGHTAEYLPPDFQDISTWPFLVMILLSIFIAGISRERLSFVDLILLAGWTGMALISARNIPIYAIIAVPILAGGLKSAEKKLAAGAISGRWRGLEKRLNGVDGRLKGGVWSVVITVGLGVALTVGMGIGLPDNQFSPQVFPVEAAAWIKVEQPQGRMFNHFPWGGYLLYDLWPDYRVFIDGQTDFYGEDLTREYECVITLCPDWQKVLDKYRVQWVIVPESSALAFEIKSEPQWTRIYADQTAVIFVKGEADEE